MIMCHSFLEKVEMLNSVFIDDMNSFQNSTPEIEQYAYELLGGKSYFENTANALPLNIKIQGGILMSDEYIPPVLP